MFYIMMVKLRKSFNSKLLPAFGVALLWKNAAVCTAVRLNTDRECTFAIMYEALIYKGIA